MTYIPTGYGVHSVVLNGTGAYDDDSTITMGFTVGPNAPEVFVEAQLHVRLTAAFATYFAGMAVGWSMVTQRSVYRFGPGNSGLHDYETAGGPVGASNNQPLPPNCTLLVRKITTTGGRANKGRFYPPGFLETNATDSAGIIKPAFFTAFQNAANALHASLISASGPGVSVQPVVLHQVETALPPAVVTAFAVQPLIATQRRRLR